MERILNYASAFTKNKNSGQNSLFGAENEIELQPIELEKTKPADKQQRLSWERELLGMYVSEHPLSGVGHLIEPYRSVKISEIKTSMENQYVRVAGIITSIQKILTKKNQNMIFAKLEDLEKNIEILVFPKLLDLNPLPWANDKIIAVDGFISYKDGSPKILAEEVWEISEKAVIPKFQAKVKQGRGAYGGNGGGFSRGGSGYSKGNDNGGRFNAGKESTVAYNTEPRTFFITIPAGSDKEILLNIKNILAFYKGDSGVVIRVPNNGNGFRDVNVKNKVENNPVLLRKLRDLVGREYVELK